MGAIRGNCCGWGDAGFWHAWVAWGWVAVFGWVSGGAVDGVAGGAEGFRRLEPTKTGIRFTNGVSIETVARNRLVEDGSGVALGDVDGDGRCDVYLGNLEGKNALYRNLGDFRFEDITASAGVECRGQATTGVALVDADGDSDLDLWVNALGGGTRLFLNDGRGRFQEKADSGLRRDGGARSMAFADVDGDGWVDVYVVNYRSVTSRDENRAVPVKRRGAGYEVPEELRDRFVADVNEAGAVVLNELGEPDVLYRNRGGGRFEAVSWTGGNFLDPAGSALRAPPRDWGLSAMFRDVNGDGAPDLYVCNDFHSPDRLWLNDGQGRFRESPPMALRKHSWASMAVDFADINADGRDDIFVAEMLGSTRWRRQVQRDNADSAAIFERGWGWLPGEATRVTAVMRNTLFLNLGGGQFSEMAHYAGVEATDWTWGAGFLDVDLDGYPDLLAANGHIRDHLNSDIQARLARAGVPRNAMERAALFRQIPALAAPKRAFRNRGDGRFEDRSTEWGFDWVGISTGMAMADLDGDGDLDLALNNMGSEALLFRNEGQRGRIAVRLTGVGGNTAGIGARIRVDAPGRPAQMQEVIAGGRYLSSDDAIRSFAAGEGGSAVRVQVDWRSGRRSVLTNVAANALLVVREEEADAKRSPDPAPPVGAGRADFWERAFERADPGAQQSGAAQGGKAGRGVSSRWFEDASDSLGYVAAPRVSAVGQAAAGFPGKEGRGGPGVSCFDLNGDGVDDVVFPGAPSGPVSVRLNDGRGRFFQASITPSMPAGVEQTVFLGWQTAEGMGLMVASEARSGGNVGADAGLKLGQYRLASLKIRPSTNRIELSGSVGVLAAGDYDGDGDLDLFVGGETEPGKYPVASKSGLLRQENGHFQWDTDHAGAFAALGLVRGAIWVDWSGDGWPDLVAAEEWGSIHVFENRRGRMVERDPEVEWGTGGTGEWSRLSKWTGWWTGVAAGDFNGDGRMDLAVGNWGRNSRYGAPVAGGLRVYFGNLSGLGGMEWIEAHRDPGLNKEAPWLDYASMLRLFPGLVQRVSGYGDYATRSVGEVFGEGWDAPGRLEAVTFDTVVLLNDGTRWVRRDLPMEAQLSPAYSPVVADFNGDGADDLFLSQNCYGTDKETGRLDSGRGLMLFGDGRGGFQPVAPVQAGIVLAGEQRGAAAGDFDRDGRPDLVVAQTAGRARLLMNRGGRPGVRIRLEGGAGNRNAVGAQVRWAGRAGGMGPAREIRAGTGFRSMDSPTVILPRGDGAERLWVRWPGGRVTEPDVGVDAREVWVGIDGTVRKTENIPRAGMKP